MSTTTKNSLKSTVKTTLSNHKILITTWWVNGSVKPEVTNVKVKGKWIPFNPDEHQLALPF